MKIFTVDFEPIYPVGCALVIIANNLKEAKELAKQTIKHTKDFKVEEIKMNKSKVVLYLSGDY